MAIAIRSNWKHDLFGLFCSRNFILHTLTADQKIVSSIVMRSLKTTYISGNLDDLSLSSIYTGNCFCLSVGMRTLAQKTFNTLWLEF